MNKIYAMILSCGILFSQNALFSTPIEEASATTETYRNEHKQYSIEYPSNWTKMDIEQLDLFLIAPAENPEKDSTANMNIITQTLTEPVSLEDFYEEALGNVLVDVHVEKTGDLEISGYPSKWLFYTFGKDIKVQILQYLIVTPHMKFIITFGATAEEFPDYLPDFEKILFSFHVL